jgi:uncharacterized coiled-coil protein SlyX
MEKDIIKLQEAIAHQGEDLAKMSHELYLQQKEISQLKDRLFKLETKIKEQGSDSGIRPVEDETPPPHY